MLECVAITTPPVSTSVLLEEEAHFSCAGTGPLMLWLINGQQVKNLVGVRFDTNVTNGVATSDLFIMSTVENDNASVQCLLIIGNANVASEPAYLTVLGELWSTIKSTHMKYWLCMECACMFVVYTRFITSLTICDTLKLYEQLKAFEPYENYNYRRLGL